MTERVNSFQGIRDIELFRQLKHTLCYVASDYELETRKAAESGGSSVEKTYELANGSEITIGSERFRCPELLFNPTWPPSDSGGCPRRHLWVYLEMRR